MSPAEGSDYGLLSLLPAALAITLALVGRQVLIALFGGVLAGALLLHGTGGLTGSLDILIKVIADADHVKIIVFTLAMGGMVGVAAAAGGTRGIVERVSRWAKTPRSAGLATWVMGMAIFFDDYASTLLVGNTMRPVTDALRMSREKLSYIVDSTAAPIASLAIVSTWIGFEVSQLGDAMAAAGFSQNPYTIFLLGIPSRFYPILALLLVGMVAFRQRDFGPMHAAETRAREHGQLLRPGGVPLVDASLVEDEPDTEGVPPRAWLAVLPVVVLVVSVLVFLWTLGAGMPPPEKSTGSVLLDVAGALGDSYDALLYGAGAGSATAILGAVIARAASPKHAVDAYVRGIRSMTTAILVLVLAWAIGHVMSELQAGAYVASLVGEALPAWSLPTITFVLSGVMALATGSSWGTMTILFPIVVPVVAVHGLGAGAEDLLIATSSSVLAGAVWGDHCSPISDTTVLSSIASAADHVDHTRTQLPYALLCGAVAIVFGTLPVGFGLPAWLLLLIGVGVLAAAFHGLSRPLGPWRSGSPAPPAGGAGHARVPEG